MRNVKATFLQAVGSPGDSRGKESGGQQAVMNGIKAEKDMQGEITCPDDYAPIWRTAFALAHNVRFTRTPDVELMRKRAAANPAYANMLQIKKEKIQIKQDAPGSVIAEQKTNSEEREKMPVSTAQILEPLCEEEAIADQTAPDILPELKKPVSVFISDSAFFECAPFDLAAMARTADNAAQPCQDTAPPAETAEEQAPEERETAIAAQPCIELTHLYRVVEWRQPPLTWITVPAAASSTVLFAEAEAGAAENGNSMEEKTRLAAVDEAAAAGTGLEKAAVRPEENRVPAAPAKALQKAPAMVPVAPMARPVLIPLPHETEQRRHSPASVRPLTNRDYVFPPITLLQEPVYKEGNVISQETLERSAGLLESVLEDFGVKGEIIHVRPGPVVTLYEFEPAPGVKSSRVIGLSDDIARSMSAISARVAVVPGRNVIGIELPNSVREMVYLREIIQSKAFETTGYKLPLSLGKNIGGEPVIAELAKMPHLLVAGTTGSGKSVAVNTMILSLLYRMPPEKCRLIMVDPKMLELSIYDGIPHLLTPVVTDPKKAVTALKWAVREMENRYRKMAKLGVRNIDGFNARVHEALKKNETVMCTVQAGFDKETGEMLYCEEAMDLTQLPYIVIIVDEMADLMMVAGKEIEGAIQRLAQMARAAGIHLIMATQRPSVDVITGTIKANFPTRISFQVTSKIDSRTILGEQGAETLLGQGDMLHMIGGGRLVRVHGPFVSDREVEHVVAHLKTQGTPEYLATVTDSDEEEPEEENAASAASSAEIPACNGSDDGEELYAQAVKVIMRDKKCSTSYIQRRLSIGYNKAATLVERMEEEGLVGAANHVGKREILTHG